MAVTITFTADTNGRQVVGQQRVVRGRITCSGTYATGGFAVAASDFGLSRLDSLEISGGAWTGTTGLIAGWDSANLKIKLFEGGATPTSNPFDEKGNTESVANYVLDVAAYGA